MLRGTFRALSLSRPNSPPTALDLLSREGGERPRDIGISSSTERSSLMPRFDPFPDRSSFNPKHLKPLKRSSRRRKSAQFPKSGSREGVIKDTISTENTTPFRIRKEVLSTSRDMPEVQLYVDINLLRTNIQKVAFPINGNFGVTKISLQQLVYCARVQEYVEFLVSAKSTTLPTVLQSLGARYCFFLVS